MKERNYKTLRDALDGLPQFAADAGAWEGIEKAMTPPLADQLPAYRPPAEVWNGLSRELDAESVSSATAEQSARRPEAAQPGTGKVRRLWPRVAGIAAALALLVSVGFGLLNYDAGPTVTYAFSQEPAPAPIVADWGQEDSSFAAVATEIEARDEPELNTLHHELTELTEASQEVQAMLVAYGDDPKVVRQLAEIERDRSDIYRRIIVLL